MSERHHLPVEERDPDVHHVALRRVRIGVVPLLLLDLVDHAREPSSLGPRHLLQQLLLLRFRHTVGRPPERERVELGTAPPEAHGWLTTTGPVVDPQLSA